MSGLSLKKVKIFPKSKRAEERVKQHGSLMLLHEQVNNNILVESLDPTWRGVTWTGWFSDNEVKFHIIED